MVSPPAPSSSVPTEVGEVLGEFRRAHGRDAWVWLRTGGGWKVAASTAAPPTAEPGAGAVQISDGAGPEIFLELGGESDPAGADPGGFLASVLRRLMRSHLEGRKLGQELAASYEEITLLYTISEILGTVISLEKAAANILGEVASALGVERAALWIHDAEEDQLELVASVGGDGQRGPIPVGDPLSATASVFRERRPMILEPGDEFPRPRGSPDAPRGSLLSVPVSYTPPDGEARTIGVINLIGRKRGDTFLSPDQKLVSAIASQIGAAVENSRLVAESVRRERMERELELAHDLQLKLLPPLDQFAGYAEVAARCAPAESVGGDFYHLFRLSGGRIGVVIGDVSSHGFGAALIMALTMSAVAIHASEGDPPAEVLRRTHQALIDELETTEMYMTLFYGVIDPSRSTITFVNAGHSHAFQVTAGGEARRLSATNPPFGIINLDTYLEETMPWTPGEDLLFLFTDGLSDALGQGEVEGSRVLVDEVVRGRGEALPLVLERLFDLEVRTPGVPADDRTAVLVRI